MSDLKLKPRPHFLLNHTRSFENAIFAMADVLPDIIEYECEDYIYESVPRDREDEEYVPAWIEEHVLVPSKLVEHPLNLVNWNRVNELYGLSLKFLKRFESYIDMTAFLNHRDIFDSTYYTPEEIEENSEFLLEYMKKKLSENEKTSRYDHHYKLLFESVCAHQTLPVSFVNGYMNHIYHNDADLILAVHRIAKYDEITLRKLVEKMYERNSPTNRVWISGKSDELPVWEVISATQDLSTSFIRDYKDYVVWDKIFASQNIDEAFVEEFKHNVCIDYAHAKEFNIVSGMRCLGELIRDNPNTSLGMKLKYMRESGMVSRESESENDILDESEFKLALDKQIEYENDIDELESLV
jgi:hypothetical protein